MVVNIGWTQPNLFPLIKELEIVITSSLKEMASLRVTYRN